MTEQRKDALGLALYRNRFRFNAKNVAGEEKQNELLPILR